jgi:hypothetical protein
VIKQVNSQLASGIVLFYPEYALSEQIRDWAGQHGGCRVAVSFERSLPGIRKLARQAALAVVDATLDPAQGADAFIQSVNMLSSNAVAVYTERMHYGLELLVRTFEAPLLLGPMSLDEWDAYLEDKFPTFITLAAGAAAAQCEKPKISRKIGDYVDSKLLHYRPNAG